MTICYRKECVENSTKSGQEKMIKGKEYGLRNKIVPDETTEVAARRSSTK